jgi:outer membrane protein
MKSITIFALSLLLVSWTFAQQTRELSLQDAVKSALEHNLDLTVEKYNPQISDAQVSFQKGIFLPIFVSTIKNNSSLTPASSDLQGAPELINKDFTYDFGLNYLTPYGTNFNVSFMNDRQVTNSILLNYNPLYISSLSFTINQPLLENFGKENTQYLVIKTEKNKKITDLAYQQKILDTVQATQNAYWDLVFVNENYRVKQESLELANKLLQDTTVRVQEGDAAPIEELAAKAEVARREEELIASENIIEKAENALKMLIDNKADTAALDYHIKPTDSPEFKEFPIELNSLVETAIKNRPDLAIADVAIESAQIDEKHFKNVLLPSLNLSFGAGLNSIGGTQLIYEGILLDRYVVGTIPGGYGDAISQLFSGDYHNWGIGFEFKYPIFNRQDKANYTKAQLQKEKSIALKTRLKQAVIIQIKNAAKDLLVDIKKIDAAKAVTQLQIEKLRAEEEKLHEGLSTNYYVLAYQDDLISAKTVELLTLITYHKNIAELQHALGLSAPM